MDTAVNVTQSLSESNQQDARSNTAGIARLTRYVFGAFTALLVIFTTAMAFIPIGGAVIGSGQLGAESRAKRIAHPTGGVVSQILVKDGDRVRRKQVLIRLDTTVSAINAGLSGQTVFQMMAERARLEAEKEGRPSILFPRKLVENTGIDVVRAVTAEQRLFALRASERRGSYAQLLHRIEQTEQQIAGYQAQIQAYRIQLALIQPERAGLRKLYDRGLVTITRLNEQERAAASLSGSIGSLEASVAEAKGKISEIREQMISVNQNARSDAGAQLSQMNKILNEQLARSASAEDQFDRSVVRAPYNGVVDKLSVTAVGDVVQGAETIMEIVPDEERLIVEAKIHPNDIDRIWVGLAARVRFTAFSAASTPEIRGRVMFVSAERAMDKETGESFYRIKVVLNQKQVSNARLKLLTGMPAEVFVASGSRSMISYLFKPLTDQLERSFRD